MQRGFGWRWRWRLAPFRPFQSAGQRRHSAAGAFRCRSSRAIGAAGPGSGSATRLVHAAHSPVSHDSNHSLSGLVATATVAVQIDRYSISTERFTGSFESTNVPKAGTSRSARSGRCLLRGSCRFQLVAAISRSVKMHLFCFFVCIVEVAFLSLQNIEFPMHEEDQYVWANTVR